MFRRRGFTILELIIVLSMMAILASVSLGRTSRMITGWRVTRAAQAYGEELQSAFAIVGRNRKPVTVTFDTAQMEVRLADRAGVIYRRRNFGSSSSYRLDSKDLKLSRLSVEIYPPGLAADSLVVEISRTGSTRRVRMLRGGLVQICATLAPNPC
jgi:prepilin-type N-terminal cleavage/methylation domain-containing protein